MKRCVMQCERKKWNKNYDNSDMTCNAGCSKTEEKL